MDTLLSLDSAFAFIIKLILLVIALGLLGYCFLVTRQIALMNRVLSTPLHGLFFIIGLVLAIASIGVVILMVFSFLG